MRHISDEGRKLIQRFEGFRSHAYKCPAGVWTIGYGTTKGVQPGDTITREGADERMKEDLKGYEAAVYAELGDRVSQGCFDAYVSLAYNIGISALRRSTTLRELKKYLDTKNDAHLKHAIRSFKWWNRGGGRVLAGLVRRRNEEVAHWLGGQ